VQTSLHPPHSRVHPVYSPPRRSSATPRPPAGFTYISVIRGLSFRFGRRGLER
jgi:hypothetical protein